MSNQLLIMMLYIPKVLYILLDSRFIIRISTFVYLFNVTMTCDNVSGDERTSWLADSFT